MTTEEAAVPARAHRQPRRDRRPHHPRLPRAGHGGRRGLQRRRRRGRPRPPGRRRRPARARRRRPRATCGSTRSIEAARSRRARRRSTRATGSSPSARRSRAPSEEAGIVFVGPSSDTIEALGDKLNARRLAARVGVPSVPGTLEPAPVDHPDQVAEIVATAAAIGFPLLVKAAAGGGGRGMRRVDSRGGPACRARVRVARGPSAFGDGSVYLEREILPARHIEVQLLADAHGHVVALGERDCSLQRRHQKLVEEAPAPGLTEAQRRHLHGLAVRLGRGGVAAQRRDLRVPPRSRRQLLVPRGQHAPPGRARRDGAGRGRGHRPRAVPDRGRSAAQPGGRRGGGAGGDAVEPCDRGAHRRGGSCACVRADAGTRRAVGHAVRSGRPGRHAHRGRRPRARRLRQPHRQGDGPCARPRRRDRPAAPGARRDGDRRRPDDAALPPGRRPERGVPSR